MPWMAEICSAVSGMREASVLIRTKAVITWGLSGNASLRTISSLVHSRWVGLDHTRRCRLRDTRSSNVARTLCPRSSTPRLISATRTKGSTTVWPVTALNNIPTSTATIQMHTPDGHAANGARHARMTTQAIAAPVRKGHAVANAPEMMSPRACASRPMAAKTRMSRTSAIAAGIQSRDGEDILPTLSGPSFLREAGSHATALACSPMGRHHEGRCPRESPILEDAVRFVQVAQHAEDLQRAAAFYAALLDAEPSAMIDPPGLLFFDVGGVRLLLEKGAPSALVYLEVADLNGTVADLRRRGVRIITEPHVIYMHEDDTLGPAGSEEWMAFIEDSEANTVALVSRIRTSGD